MYREATHMGYLIKMFNSRITPMYREATCIFPTEEGATRNNPYVQGSNLACSACEFSCYRNNPYVQGSNLSPMAEEKDFFGE